MRTLADWLAEAPFGLGMSSGFFSFFAHTGMLSALTARGLAPAHVGGSSAGALVAGAFAAGVAPEALAEVLVGLDRRDFWDPTLGLGLLAGRKFDALLRRVLPVTTFAACGRPAIISVFDIASRTTRVVRDGDLPTAIRASCAVPGMFQPVRVDGRASWDGGILDRPGLVGMPAGRTLFHHIASRSPWRRRGSQALALPQRAGLVSLVIADLPRSGPFKLAAGRAALAAARAATERALDQPLVDGVVAV
ncbi:MAG: patatin-like phospholipase family protein [Myxococcales bacterium]|nr:patatin-like phospholipase family protein [Myxococcales bacterium]